MPLDAGVFLRANESYEGSLGPVELARMEAAVAVCVSDMLRALRIEPDHNTGETPERVARMLVREVFAGRYTMPPELTDFPNVAQLDELYAVGPISIRSCCAHHLVPIIGEAWLGVIPQLDARLIGLSKLHRLTQWIMARPQIQEEATQQIADHLSAVLAPRGVAVVIRARHFCCVWRGVRDEGSLMTTSVVRGFFKEDARARSEFMSLISGMGFN